MRLSRLAQIAICALAVAVLGTCSVLLLNRPRGCVLEYTVLGFSTEENTVRIRLDMTRLPVDDDLVFYVGDMHFSDLLCEAGGAPVNVREQDGFLSLETNGMSAATVSYSAEIGALQKHGYRGAAENDLLVFEGEQVLLMPNFAFDSEKTGVGAVTVSYELPEDWTGVVPFAEKDTGRILSAKLHNPDWNDIYSLRKSCYAFGKFIEIPVDNSLSILLDSAIEEKYSENDLEGIGSLYAYFRRQFGSEGESVRLIFLRESMEDGGNIMGGASSQTIGATFSSNLGRDWELLAHRMFHAFFESEVKAADFHTPPGLWFYEGLCTYYEQLAVEELPAAVKQNAGLGMERGFASLYRQYLYMRLKDPHILTLAPIEEAKYSSIEGLTEFLHYTQAPLTIKAMEDIAFSQTGEQDNALSYILRNKRKKHISITDILEYTLGANLSNFAERYLLGSELLQLWDMPNGEGEDSKNVAEALADIEYTLWTWFRQDDAAYPLEEPLPPENIEAVLSVAERSEAHFTDEYTQEKIREFSPGVYAQLEIRAYRAAVCGLEYRNNPLLRYELAKEENLNKWEQTINEIKEEHSK